MTTSRSTRTPVILVVLDGWGFRPGREGNAIELGQTPVWHKLWQRASRTLLDASGLPVGLPDGQIGNSEVGHLNLGAGRVVYQDLTRIDLAVKDGTFYDTRALVDACKVASASRGVLHIVGLASFGGV